VNSHNDIEARAAIDKFYRAFEQKSLALLGEAVTSDWVYIPPPSDGAPPGPGQVSKLFEELSRGLPDLKVEILDLLISGDRVGVRARIKGTHHGHLLGVAPSSLPVDFAIHSFHQLRGDRIAKTWHLEDWYTAFKQIGRLPEL
jgi:hypothetical protein